MGHQLLEGAVVVEPFMSLASTESLENSMAMANATITQLMEKHRTAADPAPKGSLPFTLAEVSAKWVANGAQKHIRHYVLAASGGKDEEARLQKIARKMEKILNSPRSETPIRIQVLTAQNALRSSLFSSQPEDTPGAHDPLKNHNPVRKIANFFEDQLKTQNAPQNVEGGITFGSDAPHNIWVADAADEFGKKRQGIKLLTVQSQTIPQTSSLGLNNKYEAALDEAVEQYYETRGASKLPFTREEPGKQTGTGSWKVRLITDDDQILLQRADKKAFMLMAAQDLNAVLGKKITPGQKLSLDFSEAGKLTKAQDATIKKTTPAAPMRASKL